MAIFSGPDKVNSVKIKTYRLEAIDKRLLLHRKVSIRLLPKHPKILDVYENIVQPAWVRYMICTFNYILVGLNSLVEDHGTKYVAKILFSLTSIIAQGGISGVFKVNQPRTQDIKKGSESTIYVILFKNNENLAKMC